jgi:hypothetical protein
VPRAARVSRISAILARGARVKDLAMASAVIREEGRSEKQIHKKADRQ